MYTCRDYLLTTHVHVHTKLSLYKPAACTLQVTTSLEEGTTVLNLVAPKRDSCKASATVLKRPLRVWLRTHARTHAHTHTHTLGYEKQLLYSVYTCWTSCEQVVCGAELPLRVSTINLF